MRSTLLSLLLVLLCRVLRCAGGHTLLVAHNNGILQLDLEKNYSKTLVSADSPVVAFDVHPPWRHVYWATDYRLYRTPLYDVETTTVVAVTGRVGSVAVDWLRHAVYWTDVTRGRLEAAHTDGRGRRLVYQTQEQLGALALDPYKGKLFWIEYLKNGTGRIKSSDTFLSSNSTTIYQGENIQSFSPLELDLVYKGVNFYARNRSRTEQWEVSYSGVEGPVLQYAEEQPPVSSLALTLDGFYHANSEGLFSNVWLKQQFLFVFSADNCSDDFELSRPFFRLVDETLKNARQIRVLSNVTEPYLQDACTHHQCDQECYLASHQGTPTSHCGCAYGFRLNQDNRSCFEQGYLLYSTATTFERTSYNGGKHTVLYNESTVNIQSYDVDVKSGVLYWSDLSTQAIYRSPVELPTRSEAIVRNVTAYGVVVDWLHDHIYWTADSTVTVTSLDGQMRTELLTNLDAPAQMAIDPINRYIFWAECGQSLSLRRAGLDGSDVTLVMGNVTCGATLSVVPASRSLYWLDWRGNLHTCGYDGSRYNELVSESALAMTALDHGVLWLASDEQVATNAIDEDPLFQMSITTITDKPTGLKVVKRSQKLHYNVCETSPCTGLCLPTTDWNFPTCFGRNGTKTPTDKSTASKRENGEDHVATAYFELLESKAFSAVLRCRGTLLRYSFLHPFIQVTEVDSLVPRDHVTRLSRIVRVDNKTLPFTVDALNPATTYSVTVRNRVTRASASLLVHTTPPPLALRRLPVVLTPGANLPLAWRPQAVHLPSPNVWQHLFHRKFILLLITKKQYYLSNTFNVAEPILSLIKKEVHDYFMVVKYYASEEEFDDDPEMYLGNVPWGEELRLAMVQLTEYRGSYHLDIVYSHPFGLPDHRWVTLFENILHEQRSMERPA